MRLIFCYSCLFVLSLYGGLSAQTLSPTELAPDAFARLMQQSHQDNRQSFGSQLLVAERAFASEDFTKAILHYDKAATLGAPNSRWYLGKSALYSKLGKDSLALQVLNDGIIVYPYSNRLALAQARMTLLSGDKAPTLEEIDKLKLPAVAKVQIKALLAFQQNDLIRGLLETERAHYLAPGELIDTELMVKYLMSSLHFSHAYLDDSSGSADFLKHTSYPQGSFEDLYVRSIESAVKTYNAHQEESPVSDVKQIIRLAEIRTAILRDFVKKGHLGRFQDPMLVDLYILDNAGYLKGATIGMMLEALSTLTKEDEAEISALVPMISAAQQYMNTKWSEDVDTFLAKF